MSSRFAELVAGAELVAFIVSAYVSQNAVPQLDLPNLIASVRAALAGLG